jgi:hypothetical protein
LKEPVTMDFFSSAFLIVSDPVSIDLPELFIMDPNANRIDKKSHFYFYANPELYYKIEKIEIQNKKRPKCNFFMSS